MSVRIGLDHAVHGPFIFICINLLYCVDRVSQFACIRRVWMCRFISKLCWIEHTITYLFERLFPFVFPFVISFFSSNLFKDYDSFFSYPFILFNFRVRASKYLLICFLECFQYLKFFFKRFSLLILISGHKNTKTKWKRKDWLNGPNFETKSFQMKNIY